LAYLWKLAYCFHSEGSAEAEAFVETYLRKLLEGKVRRAIGGIRQMATKRRLSKKRREKVEQCLNPNYSRDRLSCGAGWGSGDA